MDTAEFEKQIDRIYHRFTPTAARYAFTFSRPGVTAGGVPTALFLGNHSSGKSSLVNWLLGGTPVQETGVAPTDDGFTAIVWGERDEDASGPAALRALPAEFAGLEKLGPEFLKHLKVKVRNRPILKNIRLIDSPGMIDSASGTAKRDYDFHAAVRRFVELGDLVFFLFDPEKPGTTGETTDVFAKCLDGAEFKLSVLLNKCDTFSGLYDFARAYGTLCWNLARVLRTKDLPAVYTTYSGETRPRGGTGLDPADFERHRAAFRAAFEHPGSRRTDNVFAAARADFARLSVRMRVMNAAARALLRSRIRCACLGVAAACVAGAGALFATARAFATDVSAFSFGSAVAWTVGMLAAVAVAFGAYALGRLRYRGLREHLADAADVLFADAYRRETSLGGRDDLAQTWAAVRAGTVAAIRSAPLDLPLFGEHRRARLDAAAEGVFRGFAGSERRNRNLV